MYDITKLVSRGTFELLLHYLPTPRQRKIGRKRCSEEALLNGILQVMINGVAWRKIAKCGCSYSSCYRYFREIQRRGYFKLIFKILSKEKTDIEECASDTDTILSFRFKGGVGWDGKHRVMGTKISLITDRNGLPADVEIDKGNIGDGRYCDRHIENTVGRRKKIINLDKGYTSAERRRRLRKKGIKVNMEMIRGDYIRKRGPKFTFDKEKYKMRFNIERTFGWLESNKRIRTRVDRYVSVFRSFVFLAVIVILLRV